MTTDMTTDMTNSLVFDEKEDRLFIPAFELMILERFAGGFQTSPNSTTFMQANKQRLEKEQRAEVNELIYGPPESGPDPDVVRKVNMCIYGYIGNMGICEYVHIWIYREYIGNLT